MISEISSILWGVLAVFGIILILIIVPLFLLICCCCRRHQSTIKKDIGSIIKNHKIIEEEEDLLEARDQVKKRNKSLPTIENTDLDE